MRLKLNHISIAFVILTLHLCSSCSYAQGLSRSTGLGLRLGFWNITNYPTKIDISNFGSDATVDIGGIGTWIYFFSRANNNLFLECHLGIFGGVHEEHTDDEVKNINVTSVIPILFGVRYDLLSPRLPSVMQPYLSLGGGPYWKTQVEGDDFESDGEQTIDSKLKYGGYAGGGINILLADWAAINFDLKYHFIDFQYEKNYSGIEFGLGFSFMWGKSREIFQVKDIKLVVQDIYPAYHQFYSMYPLALVTIKNVAGYPIEVKITSTVKPYSERTKESDYFRIEEGKTRDIPVSAIFGKRLLEVNEREPAVLDIVVEARAGRTLVKELSAPITIHTRNGWNGEMDKLGFFVSSDDKEIIQFTRELVDQVDIDDSDILGNFKKARIIFNNLQSRNIRYQSDPNIVFYRDDRVQYANETLSIGSGDCDDLVVLYASLLESMGIHTAFIEVKDPEKEIAHVYLMFDTNISEESGYLISSNEKRYIVREKNHNKNSIWIPVETTLINSGFDEAWKSGAISFLEEGKIRSGLEDGWVKIIDID